MISPRSVTRSISGSIGSRVGSGLITAAKNSVSKIKESTQKISKVSDKDQKFVMNYVQFFGSKKTAKILKKSLESIKQSIVATLEIASTLKKFIGEASKLMKKGRGGLFTGGGRGGLFSGIGGLVGGGLGLLFGKAALITLGLIAAGGIATILYQNKDEVFDFISQFLVDRRDELIDFMTPIIRGQIEGIFYPEEFQKEDALTEAARRNKIEELMEADPSLSEDDAFDLATKELIEELLPDRSGTNRNTRFREQSDFRNLEPEEQRRVNYLRGEVNRGILDDKGNVIPFTGKIGKRLADDPFIVNVTSSYPRYNEEQRFNLLKKELQKEGSLAATKDRIERVLPDLSSKHEKMFASDLLNLINDLRVSGKGLNGLNEMKPKEFTPPSVVDSTGKIDPSKFKESISGVDPDIKLKNVAPTIPENIVPFKGGSGGRNNPKGVSGGTGGDGIMNGSNDSGTGSGTGYLNSGNPDDSTFKSRCTLEIC